MELEEKLRSIKNEKGINLYDHLLNVIGKIILDKSPDPYTNFERISANMKNEDVFLGYSDQITNLIREDGIEMKEKVEQIRKFLKIDKNLKEKDNEDDAPKKEEEELPSNVSSNVVAQEKMARKCGVSLGEEDSYLILNALKNFSETRNAMKVSFWGKIMGLKNDYFIIESPAQDKAEKIEGKEEEVPVDEPTGTGINSKSYFVSTDILSNQWEELPVISAKQLRQARSLRYYFSGVLRKKIIASPEFNGEERHYV